VFCKNSVTRLSAATIIWFCSSGIYCCVARNFSYPRTYQLLTIKTKRWFETTGYVHLSVGLCNTPKCRNPQDP
jgi:hypothetical protein